MKKQERQDKSKEMYALIEQWQQSQKTQAAFCHEHDIAYHVFVYWLKKYRGQHGQNGNFLAMEVTNHEHTGIEILYPNGSDIQLPRTVGIHELKQLIRI